MSKKFELFKPEMAETYYDNVKGTYLISMNDANKVINREGKRSVGEYYPHGFGFNDESDVRESTTHEALMICSRSIEKIECEHKMKLDSGLGIPFETFTNFQFCAYCGKDLKNS